MSNFQDFDVSLKDLSSLNSKLDESITYFDTWFDNAKQEYIQAISNCTDKIEILNSKENIVNKTQERIDEITGMVDETKKELANLVKYKSELKTELDDRIKVSFESLKHSIETKIQQFSNEQNIKFNEFKSYVSSSLEAFKQTINNDINSLQNQFQQENIESKKRADSMKKWLILLSIVTMITIGFTVYIWIVK